MYFKTKGLIHAVTGKLIRHQLVKPSVSYQLAGQNKFLALFENTYSPGSELHVLEMLSWLKGEMNP